MSSGFSDYKFKLSDTTTWGKDDPFLLPSSAAFPTSMETVHDFSLYAYYLSGTYRQASRRTTAYFVTEPAYGAGNASPGQRWMKDFMLDSLHIKTHLMEMGEEYHCYGNSINWIYMPFDRHLVDTRGGHRREFALSLFDEEHVKFSLSRMQYQVPDPGETHLPLSKRKKVWLDIYDRQSSDVNRISLRKNDPRYMHMHMQDLSGRCLYIWRITQEPWFKWVEQGNLFWVNDTPLQILEAARTKSDFVFGPDKIFHLRTSGPSGLSSNSAWGIPDILSCYRELHNVLVYRRINEAIGLDYMMPLRLFSPNIGGSAGDMSIFGNLGILKNELGQMIEQNRRDPFSMFALPFPVSYQECNSSGKQLVPKELQEYAETRLLEAAGFPAELFHGTMKVDVIVPTLRIFENTHHPLANGLDRFVRWVGRSVSNYLTQDIISPSLAKPTMAADMERRNMMVQLAASGEISRELAYEAINLQNPVDQKLKRVEEDLEIEAGQQKLLQKHEREVMRGTLSTGEGGAGNAPVGAMLTPIDRANQSQQLASEWLQMDEGQRRKAMQTESANNPQMYAMAKQKMEEMRRQGESEGRAAVSA